MFVHRLYPDIIPCFNKLLLRTPSSMPWQSEYMRSRLYEKLAHTKFVPLVPGRSVLAVSDFKFGRNKSTKSAPAVFTKQGRQCTYNVTLRRVRVTFVAVGKTSKHYTFCVCVCVCVCVF